MTGGKAPRQKGDRFEYRVKKYLENEGFWVRRAGRSAFPDLVAIRYHFGYHQIHFVEVKMNKYVSKGEKLELARLSTKYSANSLIAYKGDKGKILFCNTEYLEYTF